MSDPGNEERGGPGGGGTALVVRSRRVVTPEGVGPAAVHVADGRIAAVTAWGAVPAGTELLDAGEKVILPGVVDTHVHLNEPGRSEWEGFASGTRAAAAGGVTTIVEMPLNSIPATTTAAALDSKVAAAAGQLTVDVGFWGGVVPGNADDLRPLWDAGAFGFKCFLSPSGVDEFRCVDEADLRAALPVLAALGAPLLVHAELPAALERAAAEQAAAEAGGATNGHGGSDHRSYATWLDSRPPAAEDEAIALLLRLCGGHGVRLHVVHLACGDPLGRIAAARASGQAVTVETCPHYLTFAAEEIPDGATAYKCAPPIRERVQRAQLWAALAAGEIDLVASDHSPAPPGLKCLDSGDFLAAWGGIASLELALPALWTGARRRKLPVHHLARWLSSAPAALAGLTGRKGAIAVGCDADLVVFDPDATFFVDAGKLHQRHPVTPYAGLELHGVVERTLLRGRTVFDRGDFSDSPGGPFSPEGPQGRVLLRGEP